MTMAAHPAHSAPAHHAPAHPAIIRITHWVGAAAMICMILSGWAIYNASPILAFSFPQWAILGGWLAGGIAWHLTAMWVLFADGLVYLAYGVLSGHFRRDLAPRGPRAIATDLWRAATFRLAHAHGHYNAVQRLLYTGVILLMTLSVLTGLAMWKPVQLGWLAWVFGGYDTARVIHFLAMSGIVAFLVIHIALVALFPSTLLTMVTGGKRAPDLAGGGAAS